MRRLLALPTLGVVSLVLAACGSDGSTSAGACKLAPGDLVLTEILSDPVGADEGGEWFEVYNATARELDLAELRIFLVSGTTEKRHTIPSDASVKLAPGAYGVLTSGARAEGDLWSFGNALGGLPNGGFQLRLLCDDGTEIDSACYGDKCDPVQTAPSEGRSLALCGEGNPSFVANNDPAAWSATTPTRGTKNATCATCATCANPLPATAETIRISEVFANPAGEDGDKEWVELCVAEGACVDLAGARLTTNIEEPSGGHVFTTTDGCTQLEGGRCYLVGGEAAATTPATEEGGSPTVDGAAIVQVTGSLSLKNSDGTLGLWVGEELVASAAYGTAEEDVANQWYDDGAGGVWCLAARPYDGWARRGSPGTLNPPCTACFCSDAEGALVEGRSPAAGELVITELLADVPGGETDSPLLEWFEARLGPAVDGPRDLACVEVRKKATDSSNPISNPTHDCMRVQPGDYVVFGRSADLTLNGGVPVDIVYDKVAISEDSTLGLYLADGTTIDVATGYGDADEGVARQVDADVFEQTEVAPTDANDLAASWCDAFIVYNEDVQGVAMKGTPGAANFSCTKCFCRTEAGEWQEAPAPVAGELRLTEIFVNTPGAEDGDKEWLELYSLASAPRYLNCLSVKVKDSIGEPVGNANGNACLPLPAESHTVLCRSKTVAQANGITDCVPFTSSDFTGSGTIALVTKAETLDQIEYADPGDGVSFMLSGALIEATTPTTAADWCKTPTTSCYYACDTEDPFVGTPGQRNPVCAP